MTGPLAITLTMAPFPHGEVQELFDLLSAALGSSETPEEVSRLLLGLVEVPEKLFRVEVDPHAAGADEMRLSLDLSEGARRLVAALRAGNVDRLSIEQALAHGDLSDGWPRGVDAESPVGETRPAAERAP